MILKKMNKKGKLGEQLSVVYFIMLLVLIALGLVWGVNIFFGKGYDVRKSESVFHAQEFKKCIEKGIIPSNEESFYNSCGFNKEVLERNKFIIRICEGGCFIPNPIILVSMNSNYEPCRFKEVRSTSYPLCAEAYTDKEGKEYHVVVGSVLIPSRGNNE